MIGRKPIDLLCLHGCVITDEHGVHMANLYEDDGCIRVVKTTACTVGTYLSILSYLRDLGFEVK